MSPWVAAFRYAMQLYPAFNFSKWFYDVSSLSSRAIDTSQGKITAVSVASEIYRGKITATGGLLLVSLVPEKAGVSSPFYRLLQPRGLEMTLDH